MSERNEVVVTYADLSETNDNDAISGLLDEHSIAKGEESILLPHRLIISIHNKLLACEGADKHNEGAFGKVEVSDKGVDRLELISWVNED